MHLSPWDYFSLVVEWTIFALSIPGVASLAYPVVFLAKFDRAKGGFQGPPKEDDWVAFAFVIGGVYTFIFAMVSVHRSLDDLMDIHVYQNMGIALGLILVFTGTVYALCAIFWRVAEGTTAWMATLTEESKKKYPVANVKDTTQTDEKKDSTNRAGSKKDD